MANDEHAAMLGRGATAWNEWRANRDETPDLSRAGLRGLDLSGFDLSRGDFRGADLRGTNLRGANLSDAHLDGANFFKAMFDGADLAGAYLNGAQFLSCAQLHLIGGTIMGTQAGNSVVNSYGQTHEIPNLYVAGPGIFATSGASNPTYPLFARSLRAAERVAENGGPVSD